MRIVTLNLRHNADRWEARFPLVVAALEAQQADIIGLQEVYLPIQQAHCIAQALTAQTPHQPYSVFVEPKWGADQTEGIGLLCRLPVIEHARLELPEAERVAQRLMVAHQGRRLHIANTHLHHHPFDDERIRLTQMRALMGWMFTLAPVGWLLVGDMNAQPGTSTITMAVSRLRSAYHSVYDRHPLTFPTPLVAASHPDISLTIDYIFYDSATYRVTAASVCADQPHPDDPTLYPSDHYGLVAEFALR
jgi:endonuclease/exonuclease/phosphatase family metal-dependent hydrolase